MKYELKINGSSYSITAGLAIGAATGLVTTMLLSGIMAKMLDNEKIRGDTVGYWIMGVLFVSSFLSGKMAYAAIKRQRLLVSVMSGALYWGILLLITALFFGGEFDSVFVTAAMIAAGSGTAGLIHFRPLKERNKKRVRYR